MKKPKVIKKGEKWLVITFFGAVDALQFFLAETVVVGTIIDIGAALIILAYGGWRGLWTGKKLLILLATFGIEFIPGLNAFPFWLGDVFYLYSGTITPEQAEEMEKIESLKNFTIPSQFTEKNGVVMRNPKSSNADIPNKQVKNGINPPRIKTI